MASVAQRKIFDILETAPVFSALSEREMEMLLENYSRVCTYKKGEIILSPKTKEKTVGVLLKGEVRVLKDYVTVSVLTQGKQFGLAGLYQQESGFVNTVIAKTNCRILWIQKEGIDKILTRNPEFSVSYISYLSGRIYYLNNKIEAYTAPTAEEKLLNFLESNCPENRIFQEVSITELTRQVNVSRASLYRALDSLTRQGVLRYEHKQIILL